MEKEFDGLISTVYDNMFPVLNSVIPQNTRKFVRNTGLEMTDMRIFTNTDEIDSIATLGRKGTILSLKYYLSSFGFSIHEDVYKYKELMPYFIKRSDNLQKLLYYGLDRLIKEIKVSVGNLEIGDRYDLILHDVTIKLVRYRIYLRLLISTRIR